MSKTFTMPTDSSPVRQSRGNSKIYHAIWSLGLLLAIFTTGCKKDDFKDEITGVCPVVVSTDPADKAVDVVLEKVISATFNTDMDPATINKTTFTIKQGTTLIPGTVAPTASAKTFTFTPNQELLPFTEYTGTITTGAKDPLHTAMVSNYVWTFTTIPQITLSAMPVAGGTVAGAGKFAQGSSVTVTATPLPGYVFVNWTENETMAATTASYTFDMAGNRALVANFAEGIASKFVVSLSANPVAGGTAMGAGLFDAGTSVTVTATANTGYTFVNWTDNGAFASTDLAYTFPLNADRTLEANFSPNIPITTYTLNVFATNGNVVKNPHLPTYNPGATVQLTPTPNTGYTFTSWSGDASGTSNPLTVIMDRNKNITANFTRIAPVGPGPINLGSAGDFTTLTKSGISTTGTTSIEGDIGVSPAAATAITGFGLIKDINNQSSHTPMVSGKVYASDYSAPTPTKMKTAVSDMEKAFTTANGLTTPAPVVGLYAGDISGRTLAPGLYKWSTGVLITNAGVTLNGGANDTWVFQISQDLTVNNNAIITLTGGAQAKNIFWVVSGQATLGSSADFSGIILSQTLISLNSGAKVTGKLLAQTAVTLNASTVKKP
jgi:uncharacterized repeat protein (TIGR02543 family)